MTETLTAQEQAASVAVTGDKGLPPGVSAKDVPKDQVTSMSDAGVPKAPAEPSSKAPVKEPTAEEKAKLAEAETAEAARVKAETDKPKDAPIEDEFESYGHPGADAAIKTMKEAGVTAKQADEWFEKAARTGNAEDMNIAEMEKVLGKDKAALVGTAVKAYYADVRAESTANAKAAADAVGGQDNFNLVKDWALKKEKADPAFNKKLNEFRRMIELGTGPASMAGKALQGLYEADPNNKSLSIKMVEGDSATSVDSAGSITRADYLAQVKVAEAKGDHVEVARLRALRTASR